MPNPTSSWEDYQSQENGPGNTYRDVAQGILAPGISWIAQGTHNAQALNNITDFAGLWKNSVENKDMTQDVYNSMTPSEWDAFQKMDGGGQSSFISSRKQQLAKNQPNVDSQNAMISQLQKFADEMNMPVDQLLKNDAFAKQLRSSSMGQAAMAAQNRGFGAGGGVSTQNADLTSKQALLGYQMQRQQMGNQALGQIADIRNQQQGFNLTQDALNNQSANAFLAQQAAQQQKMQSGLMAIAGGGAGLLGAGAGMLRSNMASNGQPVQSGFNPMTAPVSYPSYNYGGGSGGSYGTYQAPGGAGVSGVGFNMPQPIQTTNVSSITGNSYTSPNEGGGGAEGGND